jgi:hypothetical protein
LKNLKRYQENLNQQFLLIEEGLNVWVSENKNNIKVIEYYEKKLIDTKEILKTILNNDIEKMIQKHKYN